VVQTGKHQADRGGDAPALPWPPRGGGQALGRGKLRSRIPGGKRSLGGEARIHLHPRFKPQLIQGSDQVRRLGIPSKAKFKGDVSGCLLAENQHTGGSVRLASPSSVGCCTGLSWAPKRRGTPLTRWRASVGANGLHHGPREMRPFPFQSRGGPARESSQR